jgi:hypothetical protein
VAVVLEQLSTDTRSVVAVGMLGMGARADVGGVTRDEEQSIGL